MASLPPIFLDLFQFSPFALVNVINFLIRTETGNDDLKMCRRRRLGWDWDLGWQGAWSRLKSSKAGAYPGDSLDDKH